MQQVVDPLGHLEELGRAFDHDPALIYAGASIVRNERGQQLRHATTTRGGVDVPHRAPAQRTAELRHRSAEFSPAGLTQNRPVTLDLRGFERNMDQLLAVGTHDVSTLGEVVSRSTGPARPSRRARTRPCP